MTPLTRLLAAAHAFIQHEECYPVTLCEQKLKDALAAIPPDSVILPRALADEMMNHFDGCVMDRSFNQPTLEDCARFREYLRAALASGNEVGP